MAYRLTNGQYRVGVTFNPSKDELVDEIKARAADLIDLIGVIPQRSNGEEQAKPLDVRGAEINRLKREAQNHVEVAAMFAVKAVTKPPRE